MYYAKFVSGSAMGRLELMDKPAPTFNFAVLGRVSVYNPPEPMQDLPVTELRYELRHVIGDLDNKFCFYAQVLNSDEGWN